MSLVISDELVQASGLSEVELLYIHYDVNDLHEDVQNLQELGLL
jgi:predicted HTH domain antitoxin